MPDGTTIRPKLKLRSEQGQILGSTSFRSDSESSITNTVFRNGELRFQVIRQREGQDIVTTYAGIWNSNVIKGTIESNWLGEKRVYDWEAQRAGVGVEGVWRWTNSFFAGFGGRGGGGGRASETRVELEQNAERLTGQTISQFGRPSPITNGILTNGVVYFEIDRVIFNNRSLTKYRGEQKGDTIKGTMESEIEGEARAIDWEAARVD